LRSIVSDARGKVFAGNGIMGDYVEDPVLLEGIRRLLLASGIEMESHEAYKSLKGTDSL